MIQSNFLNKAQIWIIYELFIYVFHLMNEKNQSSITCISTELCNLCKQDEWWLQEMDRFHPVTYCILLLFLFTHHLKLRHWYTVYITLAFVSTNIPIVLVIDDKMRSNCFTDSVIFFFNLFHFMVKMLWLYLGNWAFSEILKLVYECECINKLILNWSFFFKRFLNFFFKNNYEIWVSSILKAYLPQCSLQHCL